MVKYAYSNDSVSNAGGNIATDRVSQAGQVSGGGIRQGDNPISCLICSWRQSKAKEGNLADTPSKADALSNAVHFMMTINFLDARKITESPT